MNKPRVFLRGSSELDVVLPGTSGSVWCNFKGGRKWYDCDPRTVEQLERSRAYREIKLCEARRLLREAGMTLPK